MNETVTRVPTSEEIIAITFSLTLSELSLYLELKNSSLSDMYTALAATIETNITQIEIVETVGSTGTLELLLISNHFQIEPRLTAELLRSPMNRNWAPYYTIVTNVITSESEFNHRVFLFIICRNIMLLCRHNELQWILPNPTLIRLRKMCRIRKVIKYSKRSFVCRDYVGSR